MKPKKIKETVQTTQFDGFSVETGLCTYDKERYDFYQINAPSDKLLEIADAIFPKKMSREIEITSRGRLMVLNFLPCSTEEYIAMGNPRTGDPVFKNAGGYHVNQDN